MSTTSPPSIRSPKSQHEADQRTKLLPVVALNHSLRVGHWAHQPGATLEAVSLAGVHCSDTVTLHVSSILELGSKSHVGFLRNEMRR